MKKGVIAGIVLVVIILIAVGVLFFMRNSSPNVGEDASLSGDEASNVIDNLDTSNMNILVAYYSHTGNTEGMAEEIANQVNGDLFKIERAAEYNDLYTEAEDEINNEDRPELADTVDNMDSYDVIFIGYPIWWDMPPAMINSFLESYDLTDKIVIPFCTSSSDGIENSVSSIRASSENAVVLDGLRLSGNGASSDSGKEEISNWLNSLDIFESED